MLVVMFVIVVFVATAAVVVFVDVVVVVGVVVFLALLMMLLSLAFHGVSDPRETLWDFAQDWVPRLVRHFTFHLYRAHPRPLLLKTQDKVHTRGVFWCGGWVVGGV